MYKYIDTNSKAINLGLVLENRDAVAIITIYLYNGGGSS